MAISIPAWPLWRVVKWWALNVGIQTTRAPVFAADSTARALSPPTSSFSATAPTTVSPGYTRVRISATGAVG